MDYAKYLKTLGVVGALIVAYGAGHHFGAAQRPALPHLPQPTALHRMAHQRPIVVNCGCGKKHSKHAAKPKTASKKKHKEKAGKAHQGAPPSK